MNTKEVEVVTEAGNSRNKDDTIHSGNRGHMGKGEERWGEGKPWGKTQQEGFRGEGNKAGRGPPLKVSGERRYGERRYGKRGGCERGCRPVNMQRRLQVALTSSLQRLKPD